MNEMLYVLGTGNAAATNCYNTCFAIRDERDYLLVDAGGGNGILPILRDLHIPLTRIHHILATHAHTDHLLGIIWMVRMIASSIRDESYEGDLHIYGQDKLLDLLRMICTATLPSRLCATFDDRIHFVPVTDGETRTILDYPVTFFDIHSTKADQFGFTLTLHNGRKLTCLGDEPYNPLCRTYAENSDWLLCEAFCLYGDKDIFHPYEKHHSTVQDAALLAGELNVSRLLLWHTEDTDLIHRKERYTREALQSFKGTVYVPNDGEIIRL
jgi:ribonuclease Z